MLLERSTSSKVAFLTSPSSRPLWLIGRLIQNRNVQQLGQSLKKPALCFSPQEQTCDVLQAALQSRRYRSNRNVKQPNDMLESTSCLLSQCDSAKCWKHMHDHFQPDVDVVLMCPKQPLHCTEINRVTARTVTGNRAIHCERAHGGQHWRVL